tara:strand:+ start:151 stop:567 length:417 start_codon:yes stop_codon:yes gene_type:complete
MINKIKKTLSQALFSEDSTKLPFWDDEDIECAIDEEVVDCSEIDSPPYVGVPAPNYLPHDDWFPNPFMKDKEIEFAGNYEGPLYAPYTAVDAFKKSIGDDGMHQKMYDMSTRSGKTTLQLNPIGGSENFQGGSENVHR